MCQCARNGPAEILLVEDSPGDARLAMEALKDARIDSSLHHVPDGVQAMAFLRREGEYRKAPTPDVILLDQNLPKKDGREVLAEVKADPGLRHIPVVILTSSRAEEDIVRTYDLHADCYITKPLTLDRFVEAVRLIADRWLAFAVSSSSDGTHR